MLIQRIYLPIPPVERPEGRIKPIPKPRPKPEDN
jgi:hypothetical protein